jgi:hypothetical protein
VQRRCQAVGKDNAVVPVDGGRLEKAALEASFAMGKTENSAAFSVQLHHGFIFNLQRKNEQLEIVAGLCTYILKVTDRV